MGCFAIVVTVTLLLTQGLLLEAGPFYRGMEWMRGRCRTPDDRRSTGRWLADRMCGSSWDCRRKFGDERNDTEYFKRLSEFLDEMERRARGRGEELVREAMRRLGLPQPRRYKAYNGLWTRAEAARECTRRGQRLAVIRNAMEQSLAWEAAMDVHRNRVYIGLHHNTQGTKYWYDGTPYSYNNILRMVHFSLPTLARCYVMHINTGEWRFKSCNQRNSVLCESPSSNTSTTTTSAPRSTTSKTSTARVTTPLPRTTTFMRRTTTTGKPVARTVGPTEPPVRTTVAPAIKAVDFEVRMGVNYDEALADPNFKSKMIATAARILKRPASSITVLYMRPGSIIVLMRVNAPRFTPEEIAAMKHLLTKAIASGDFAVTVNGRRVVPSSQTYNGPFGPVTSAPPVIEDEGPPFNKLIFVLIALGLLVVIVVIGIILFVCKRTTKSTRHVADVYIEERLPKYEEATASAPKEILPPPEKDAPPKYDECIKTSNA